ncbi:MAG: hypothetical protein HQ579_07880 [Candidatus Omnitrophica bacterium]|nr:hypothetical protein [Candidatus Omnitrophota bacterium]
MYVDKRYNQYEIGERFGCSQWVISNRLRHFGIKTRPKTYNFVNRKYSYNRDFLKNITPDISWVLGLLVSDGFVRKNNLSAYFGLKLKREDEDVIFKVKKILKYQGPIYRGMSKLEHKGYVKEFSYSLLHVNDVNAVKELEQLGIRENKTHNEIFLECIKETNNEEIISSFIRGIYDGDGSFLFDKKRNSMCFQIVGTYHLMQEIQNHLMHYCRLNKTKLTQNILGTNHYALRYRGNVQTVRILNWVYKCSNHFNRMDRKFDNFCKIWRTTDR